MECPRCHSTLPQVARYCHHCGHDVVSQDLGRKKTYAAQPNQPVAKFAPVGTIMPRGTAGHPMTYAAGLIATLVIMVITAALGAVPIAVWIAAFAIPIVYIVYIYDVNLWEDSPIPVTLLAFGLTFGLAIGWTLAWEHLRGVQPMVALPGVSPGLQISGFLIVVLLAPVVGELIRQIGPVVLASRKQFDDLMDGFTFGVISGVAYAAGETLVMYWSMLRIGFAGSGNIDALQMIVLLLLHGFVKPIIYGTATGIAGAEFSGLGEGYDGFTPRWLRGVGIAIAAVALFNAGSYLSALIPASGLSVIVALGWAVLLLACLTLMARNVLHVGLLEAALEATARSTGVGADGELRFCASCEMPLLDDALFCSNCGLGLRAVQRIPVVSVAPPAEQSAVTAETKEDQR